MDVESAINWKGEDKDKRKIIANVFDNQTFKALHKLMDQGYVLSIDGLIKIGKEAHVFRATGPDGPLAVKIYMVEASDFKNMLPYIQGDHRFLGVKKRKKDLVYAWCRKEFRNLARAYEVDANVPKPIARWDNVLVMELIENSGEIAKQMNEAKVKNPISVFDAIVADLVRIVKDGGLVHADLSQFNILMRDGKPVIIDIGQAVLLDHPMAKDFLKRDVKNIVKFFNKTYFRDAPVDEKKIYEKLVK